MGNNNQTVMIIITVKINNKFFQIITVITRITIITMVMIMRMSVTTYENDKENNDNNNNRNNRRLGGENGVTPTGKSFRFVRACERARRSCVGGREK